MSRKAERARIIWPSFLASSGLPSARLRTGSPCDVPFRYGNQHPVVARWHAHLCGLATAIHKISGPKKGREEQGYATLGFRQYGYSASNYRQRAG
jgi:hypothetical protein